MKQKGTIVSKSFYTRSTIAIADRFYGNNCGVFVAITVAYWVMQQRLPTTFDWTHQHMPKSKLHMAATLFENDTFNILIRIQQQRQDGYNALTKDELEKQRNMI